MQGMAFEFSNANRERVTQILKKREGDGFEFPELEIVLRCGERIHAMVPNYIGTDLFSMTNENDVVDAIKVAAGKNGSGKQYVIDLAAKLQDLGIDDDTVTTLKNQLLK